jgi:NADPH:quinone reductase
MKAVQITAPGPADAMKLVDVAVPAIGDDQVLVRVAYAGINYIDTYQRGGLYPVPLPFVMGREASGVVETMGTKVESLKQSDRVRS